METNENNNQARELSRFESWQERNRIRSNDRYRSMVEQNFEIKKVESLLAHLSRLWGLGKPIPASEFENLQFPYFVCTGITTQHSEFAFVVGRYAYSFYDNFTFKIFENE